MSSKKKDSSSSENKPFKLREDTIPVIIVSNVYFPTQKLRFKLSDP